MSSCRAVTLFVPNSTHKNQISKPHSGQMPVQIQTLASLQQYRGSWQFLLDDKKSLIEKRWSINQPIKYGGQALPGCMHVMFNTSRWSVDHFSIIPPPKKKTWILAKGLGSFWREPKKNLQKFHAPKKTSVGPLELMAGIFFFIFLTKAASWKEVSETTNGPTPPNGDEQKIPRSLLTPIYKP